MFDFDFSVIMADINIEKPQKNTKARARYNPYTGNKIADAIAAKNIKAEREAKISESLSALDLNNVGSRNSLSCSGKRFACLLYPPQW